MAVKWRDLGNIVEAPYARACGNTARALERNDATGRALRKMLECAKAMVFTTCDSTGEYVRTDTILAILSKSAGLDQVEPEPPVECERCEGKGFRLVGMSVNASFYGGPKRVPIGLMKLHCTDCGGWGIVFMEGGRGGHRQAP